MTQDSSTRPKQATQLGILGVLCRAPALGAEIVSLVKHIVGRAWQPTSDVIGSNIDELLGRGLIACVDPGRNRDTTQYAITDKGRELLDGLLRTPLQSTATGLDPAAVSLKVCFLDLLDHAARREQLTRIIELYESDTTHLRDAIQRCACEWEYVPSWMELEVGRLETETDWFRNLLSQLDDNEAVAAGAAHH
jgi:DNA-binding PadR family transcriptional regulator